jgi:hypothetical protein
MNRHTLLPVWLTARRRAWLQLVAVAASLSVAAVMMLVPFKTDTLVVSKTATFANTVVCVAGGNLTATGGIQECINQLGGNPGKVELSGGSFNVTASISITNDNQHVVGAGIGATNINFTPGSPLPLFVVGNSAEIVNIELGGFQEISAVPVGDAIRLVDAGYPYIHDITIQNWNGTALHLEGKESGTLERIYITANNPIIIDANPHNGNAIELDAFDFEKMNLAVLANGGPGLGTGNAITITGITSTTVIQHLSMNRIDIEGGLNGVDMEDANVTGFAFNGWDLRAMHWEQQQGSAGSGYMLKFNRTAGLTNHVVLTNILAGGGGGAPNNGFYFRNTLAMTATDLGFDGTTPNVALDADASNDNLTLINPFFQTGSTVTNNSINNSIDVGGTPNALNLHGNQIHNVGASATSTDAANIGEVTSSINTAVNGVAGRLPIFTSAHVISSSNEGESGGFFFIGPELFVAIASGAITSFSTGANVFDGTLQVVGQTLLGTNGTGPVASYAPLEVINGAPAVWQTLLDTHVVTEGGTPPTVTACGTGTVTASSTDVAPGATATGATSCSFLYGHTYNVPGVPVCNASNGTANITANSATGFTVAGFVLSATLYCHVYGLGGST